MVARTSAESPESANVRVGTFSEPPCPLPPALRSDIAYRRARGHPWEALGVSYRYDSDALRRACEADPEFAPLLEKAWAEATREAEADALRRLRLMAHGEDEDKALKAATVLLKYVSDRRRDETRLACEKVRAEARLEAERMRAELRASKSEAEAGEVWVMPPQPAPETEQERQERFDREHAERAALPKAYVYIWGGKHPLGRSHAPDESDTRVRLEYDASCGEGARGIVYWVVPDAPSEAERSPAACG